MRNNTPLCLEMVIFDPNSPPGSEPLQTHIIRFSTADGRKFMNKTAVWAWTAGYAVATKAIDNKPKRN